MPTFEEGFSAAEKRRRLGAGHALNEATNCGTTAAQGPARTVTSQAMSGRLTERSGNISECHRPVGFQRRHSLALPVEEERPYLEQEYSEELRSEGGKRGCRFLSATAG